MNLASVNEYFRERSNFCKALFSMVVHYMWDMFLTNIHKISYSFRNLWMSSSLLLWKIWQNLIYQDHQLSCYLMILFIYIWVFIWCSGVCCFFFPLCLILCLRIFCGLCFVEYLTPQMPCLCLRTLSSKVILIIDATSNKVPSGFRY